MSSQPTGSGAATARGLAYEWRVALMALALVLPALGVACGLLWLQAWVLAAPERNRRPVLLSAELLRRLRRLVVHPLLTLVNLLDALRAGDYSLRVPSARCGDALGEVLWEVNALSSTLREQRLKVEESARC